jgi:hypothetical protein
MYRYSYLNGSPGNWWSSPERDICVNIYIHLYLWGTSIMMGSVVSSRRVPVHWPSVAQKHVGILDEWERIKYYLGLFDFPLWSSTWWGCRWKCYPLQAGKSFERESIACHQFAIRTLDSAVLMLFTSIRQRVEQTLQGVRTFEWTLWNRFGFDGHRTHHWKFIVRDERSKAGSDIS